MSRKVFDVQPIITARFVGGEPVTTVEASAAQVADTIAQLGSDFECTVAYETDAKCEHCLLPWTEESPDYNGGCCAKDIEPARVDALNERGSVQ